MAGFELYAPRLATHRRTWTLAVIGLCLLFNTVAGVIAFIPYIMDTVQFIATHPNVTPAMVPKPSMDGLWFLIVPCVLEIVMVWAWIAVFERRTPAAIGFNGHGLLRFVRGYLVGCAMLVFVVGSIWLLGGYKIESPGFWEAPTAAALAPILIYVIGFVIQGSSEEVLMRGWLMQLVASRHGIVLAVIINSMLFGAAHLGNPGSLVPKLMGCGNVALFGVFISLYACRERSLWGVCGWHGAWNWLLGVGFGLEVSGLKLKVAPLVVDLMDVPNRPVWLTGAEWGPEASVVTTLMLVTGIAILVWKGALKPGESYAVPVVEEPPEEAY